MPPGVRAGPLVQRQQVVQCRRSPSCGSTAAMVSALTRWMASKRICRSRKAATATSLAAFSTAVLPSGPRSAVPGQVQAGEAPRVGVFEGQRRQGAEVERAPRPTRCAAGRTGHRRSARACRACPAAPARSRRGTRTIEWMMLCGWITTRICSGARSNSQRASMTSSALFIIVAESTEILRPMTQLGWAQASSGVTLCSVAGSRVRNGPPDAVSTMWSMVCGHWLRCCGRHWKIAECSLSIGSSVAPPSLHRAHEQRATDHQRLLVGQQQPLAGARRSQAGRQAGGADDGRHHAVDLGVGRHVAQRLRAAEHLGGQALRRAAPRAHARTALRRAPPPSAAASAGIGRCSSSMRCIALRPKTSKRSGWRDDHVERAGADRAGGAEDDESLARA